MKRMILFFALLVSVTVWAGGDETNNGAGGGEFNIIYARQTLPRLLDACSASPNCRAGIADEIRKLLDRKPWEKTQIKFLTSREMGDRLSQNAGAVIEINKNALHKSSADGLRPWGFAEAIVFLLENYGAREGLETSVTRKLSQKVATLAVVDSQTSVISDPGYEQFSFVLFREPLSTLIVEDAKGLSDSFEVPFTKQLNCFLTSDINGLLQNVRVESAYWSVVNAHSTRPDTILSITGRLTYSCEADPGILQRFVSHYRVSMTIRPVRPNEDQRWIIDRSTLVIEQSGIEEQR